MGGGPIPPSPLGQGQAPTTPRRRKIEKNIFVVSKLILGKPLQPRRWGEKKSIWKKKIRRNGKRRLEEMVKKRIFCG